MDEPAMTGNIDADDASAPTDRIADQTADELPGGDTAENHAARAALYSLLGGVFAYPDEKLLADLTADDARNGVEQAAERLGFGTETRAVLDALEGTAVDEQAAAYNKLFGLPEEGQYPVVPYEAHYTTGSEVSEEQRRIATVVGLMETFGVEPSFDERQDHVAAELELMQVVAAQHATALYQGDSDAATRLARAETTLLDTHLVGFVPAFARDLHAATSNDVYQAAADLAAELVRTDHRWHSHYETLEVETDG